MFYVATVRYAEDHGGSTILGIYSTEQEAMEILKLYEKNASFEVLEIQHITKNLKPEDLKKIKPYITPSGEEFVKVDGEEYESQGEYFHTCGILSTTLYSETVNR